MNLLHEYNSMYLKLKNFLQNFSETKQEVKKEDILNFFEEMNNKRRKLGKKIF
jgi:hypothetical protein